MSDSSEKPKNITSQAKFCNKQSDYKLLHPTDMHHLLIFESFTLPLIYGKLLRDFSEKLLKNLLFSFFLTSLKYMKDIQYTYIDLSFNLISKIRYFIQGFLNSVLI